MLELEETLLDSLNLVANKLYDSLIIEQNKEIAQWKNENELSQFEYAFRIKRYHRHHTSYRHIAGLPQIHILDKML